MSGAQRIHDPDLLTERATHHKIGLSSILRLQTASHHSIIVFSYISNYLFAHTESIFNIIIV